MIEEFSEKDLERAIEQIIEAPEPTPEDLLPRYAMSFLINIPLYKHVGNSAFVRLNQRDETGLEIRNTEYFPRLMLLPFKMIKLRVPAETPAARVGSGVYEDHKAAFSPVAAESNELLRRIIEKNPALCAKEFKEFYQPTGAIVLDALTGIESYRDAKKIFNLVLPLQDQGVFPARTRIIESERFSGPFLNDILDYLQTEARTRIENPLIPVGQRERVENLYSEVTEAVRAAINIARSRINESEAAMSASPQEKIGYDRRDTRFANSPEPFDLLCLAHLGEKPKSERALEQARKLQSESNAPMNDAARSLVEAANLMRQSPAPEKAADLTREDILKMLDERAKSDKQSAKAFAETVEAEVQKRMAAATAAAAAAQEAAEAKNNSVPNGKAK